MNRFIAFLLILITSPIWSIFILLIILEDGSPFIFRQIRVGANQKNFTIYKLRSMKINTPQISSNSLENPESYMLKIGRIARKFSIDEFPNLINIVMGEMNFIGPRPLMPSELELLDLRTRYQIDKMKPGITGYAQINGRDEVTIHEKVVLEKFYLENKSIILDIKIILQTIVVVFKAVGVRF